MEANSHLPQQDPEKNVAPASTDQQRQFCYTRSVTGAVTFSALGYTAQECSLLMHSKELASFKKRIYAIIAIVLLSISVMLLIKIGATPMFY